MTECMMFPDEWAKFMEDYSFVDSEEVYTNGTELIPTFRVEQMIEHYFAKDINVPSKWIPVTERLPEELPKDSSQWSERVRPSVDVLVKIEGLQELQTAWYSYSYKDWTDVREEHGFTGVTHWMPLPEPPKE